MMTSHVVAAVINGAWLLAVIPTVYGIVTVSKGMEMLEYGACKKKIHLLHLFWLFYYQFEKGAWSYICMCENRVLFLPVNIELTAWSAGFLG